MTWIGPHTPEPCPYNGTRKIIMSDRVYGPYCAAHARDWAQSFHGVRVYIQGDLTGACRADWVLSTMVPS